MSDIEKRRSDVLFWQRKYERDRSKYARGMLKNASDRLKLAEIDAENKRNGFTWSPVR